MTGTAVSAFASGMGLVSREELAHSLGNAAMAIPNKGGEYQWLKMDKKTGEWFYGQDETLVEPDALIAVNPYSLRHGYIAWLDLKHVEGEQMVPINQPLPSQAGLPQVKAPKGWQLQLSVDMAIINGDDAGIQLQYKHSSVGALKAFSNLTSAIFAKVKSGADEIVPIIQLKGNGYDHKEWGHIINPILDIVEWRAMDDGSAPTTAAAAEPPAKTEPPPRTRAPRPTPEQLTASAAAAPGAMTKEEEDAALAAEYAQEQAAAASAGGGNPAVRRRARR